MSTIGIPPNGFAGSQHQSAAVQHHVAKNMGSRSATGSRPRKKRKSKAKTPRKAHSRRASSKGITILKAGSAAAKAWGAKMKRLRKAKLTVKV